MLKAFEFVSGLDDMEAGVVSTTAIMGTFNCEDGGASVPRGCCCEARTGILNLPTPIRGLVREDVMLMAEVESTS